MQHHHVLVLGQNRYWYSDGIVSTRVGFRSVHIRFIGFSGELHTKSASPSLSARWYTSQFLHWLKPIGRLKHGKATAVTTRLLQYIEGKCEELDREQSTYSFFFGKEQDRQQPHRQGCCWCPYPSPGEAQTGS